jgi:hypothetical protein
MSATKEPVHRTLGHDHVVFNDKHTTPKHVLELEAKAEAERARFAEASLEQVDGRCPECGALGSLEEVEGVLTCIDCDETVLAERRMGGFGRK